MTSEIAEALAIISGAIKSGGSWYAAAAGVVVLCVRLYRMSEIQSLLPASARWERLALPLRLCIVFAVSALAAWAASVIAGHGVKVALLAAVATAIASIGTHEATKAIGHAHTAVSIDRRGLDYRPGSIRTVLSPIFPIAHDQVDAAARLARSADLAAARRDRQGPA